MFVYRLASFVKSIEFFFLNSYRIFLGFAKVIILSKFFPSIPQTKNQRCIIVGNGPSLKKTLKEFKEKLSKEDLVVVNNFASAEEFQELMPRYYVLLDPGFFLLKERKDVRETFGILQRQTTWEMVLFIPHLYRNDLDIKKIKHEAKNIKVVTFNYTLFKGFESISFFMFKRNLAMPQFYNVMGASIILGINMGYKELWLTGADHNWFNDIEVDNENKLSRRDYHFYDKSEILPLIPIIDPITGKTQRIGDFFNALFKVFDSYYLVQRYANYRKAEIYNVTEGSYIDAFKRKKLEF